MRHPVSLALVVTTLPAAAAQSFDPPEAVDLDPDPHVVEVALTSAETTWQFLPGIDTTVWAYNGSVPGPTIRGNVGDLLRVHFTNDLPEPTTIHWHGVELPADQDGSHIAQRPVQPGETFDYEFRLLRDSLYWYHPHVRSFDQVEKGLYGGLLVRDRRLEHELGLDEIEEHLLFFDDVLLDTSFQIVPAFSFADPLANALYHVNGREGNYLLLNGREVTGATLPVANGEPLRLRVVNAANTTFCRLDVNDPGEGLTSQLYEIGSDGGFLELPYARRPVTTFVDGEDHAFGPLIDEMGEGILLLPGERMDAVFTPIGNDGDSFRIFQNDFFRGRHSANYGPGGVIVLGDDPMDGLYPRQPYLDLVVQGPDPGRGEYEPPAALRPRPPLSGDPRGVLPVTFGHGDPDPDTGAIVLFAQAQFVGGVMIPLPAAKIDSFNAHDVEVGDVWDWQVTNLTHGDHPFHTHGFFFELLGYEWQDDDDPTTHYLWSPPVRRVKDTIRIPARLGQRGRSRTISRLRVHFDDQGREDRVVASGMQATFEPSGAWQSGGWLFHCHVLEHSAVGMLSVLEVHDPDEVFTLLGKHTAGTLGLPHLTASGDLSPGSVVQVDLVNALPGARARLVVGDVAQRAVLGTGELVPGFSVPVSAFTPRYFLGTHTGRVKASGRRTWRLDEWEVLPSGTDVYVQVAFRDPGAVGGWALSNALHFTRP